MGLERVTVRMPGYVADFLADLLMTEHANTGDEGWRDLAQMLRIGGRDHEIVVERDPE